MHLETIRLSTIERRPIVFNIIVDVVKMPIVSVLILTLPLNHIGNANLWTIEESTQIQFRLRHKGRKHTTAQ